MKKWKNLLEKKKSITRKLSLEKLLLRKIADITGETITEETTTGKTITGETVAGFLQTSEDIFVLEDNKRLKDINNTHTEGEKNIESIIYV